MNQLKVMTIAAAVSIGVLGASGSWAVTDDGDLGTTSSGTLDITLNIPARFQISQLDPIALTPVSDSSSKATGYSQFCVYSNAASNGYGITASGSYGSSSDAFKLVDSSDTTVDYKVFFDDSVATSATEGMTHGSKTSAKKSSNTLNCDDSPNATIYIETADNVDTITTGDYSGVLTLLIEAS